MSDVERGRSYSFTLVEVMIVVAIIALLAAISIPSLSRIRTQADEQRAIATVKAIFAAEGMWRVANPDHATIGELTATTPPYVEGFGASHYGWYPKQRYYFIAYRGSDRGWGNESYAIHAQTTAMGTATSSCPGCRSFCASEDGVVRVYYGGPPAWPNCAGNPVGE